MNRSRRSSYNSADRWVGAIIEDMAQIGALLAVETTSSRTIAMRGISLFLHRVFLNRLGKAGQQYPSQTYLWS